MLLDLLIIMLINLLHTTILFGIKPVISLHASSLGISPVEISVIVACYALLPVFLAVQMGKWIDKYGVRRMLLLGNSMYLLAVVMGSVYPNLITFVLQQSLIGIAVTLLMVSLQKYLGNLGGDVNRAVANFTLSGSLGSMIGPLLSLALYEYYGYEVVCYVHILLNLLVLMIGFLVKKEDLERTSPISANQHIASAAETSVWSMLRSRNLRNAILIGGLVLSNRELFAAYFPLLAEQMGVSPSMIGILLSISGFTMLIVRFWQSVLVRAFGRMNVLTWSLYISGVIYVLAPFSPWLVVLVVFVSILGGSLGLGQPLSLAYVLEVSPSERRGEVLGLRMTVNRASQFVIPLFFGGIGGFAGVSAIFWASGIVLAFFGYVTRALPKDNRSVYKIDV